MIAFRFLSIFTKEQVPILGRNNGCSSSFYSTGWNECDHWLSQQAVNAVCLLYVSWSYILLCVGHHVCVRARVSVCDFCLLLWIFVLSTIVNWVASHVTPPSLDLSRLLQTPGPRAQLPTCTSPPDNLKFLLACPTLNSSSFPSNHSAHSLPHLGEDNATPAFAQQD